MSLCFNKSGGEKEKKFSDFSCAGKYRKMGKGRRFFLLHRSGAFFFYSKKKERNNVPPPLFLSFSTAFESI